jgi:hypothetical protein
MKTVLEADHYLLALALFGLTASTGYLCVYYVLVHSHMDRARNARQIV